MASPPTDDVMELGGSVSHSVPDGEKAEPAVGFAPPVSDGTGPPASRATSAAAATATAATAPTGEQAAGEDLTKVKPLRSG